MTAPDVWLARALEVAQQHPVDRVYRYRCSCGHRHDRALDWPDTLLAQRAHHYVELAKVWQEMQQPHEEMSAHQRAGLTCCGFDGWARQHPQPAILALIEVLESTERMCGHKGRDDCCWLEDRVDITQAAAAARLAMTGETG